MRFRCGENIREARKKAGLTQEQLAKKCGFATITIGQYERGSREPRLEQLQAIADAVGVHVLELLGIPAKYEYRLEGTLHFSIDLMTSKISKKYGLPEETARNIVNDCYQAFRRDGHQFDELTTLGELFDYMSADDRIAALAKLQELIHEENSRAECADEC